MSEQFRKQVDHDIMDSDDDNDRRPSCSLPKHSRRPLRDTESCECKNKNSSLFGLLQSMIITDGTFTIDDIFRYTILMVSSFAFMVYLFPSQILLILLLLVLIVVWLARLMLVNYRRTTSHYIDKPIDAEKLEQLRAKLKASS